MRDLLRFYFRFIGWCIRWAIVVWFALIPCLMLFGFFSPWPQAPWPEARQEFDREGIHGVPLLIGMGGASGSDSNGVRKESKQRSYIVVPYSFRHMEVVSYTLEKWPGGARARIEPDRILLPLLILYAAAGVHTFFVFRRLLRRRRARLAQAG